MTDFDELFRELKAGVTDIVRRQAADYLEQGLEDGEKFLAESKSLLTKWAKELADGKMSEDEFKSLVRGRLFDLAEMEALTQAGLARIRVDAIRIAMVDFVIAALVKRI